MAVVTIARKFGAGGRTLAGRVAKRLGYEFLDDAIIQELAERARVSKHSIKDIERSAGGWLSKVISSTLSRGYMERLTGERFGYIDEEIYVEKLREVITELAAEDNVVILGRGSQYILAENENTYHFLLVAEREDRIKFMQRYYDYSDEKAYQAVINGERRRKNLYAKFGKKNYNAASMYHMVMNMSRITLDQAEDQICMLVEPSKS
ncbi:MAG: cytidylate kinase-like family protein [Thermodesulfobacteriota bacterium]|nr:cytidylate kinase-like family protein [Thermodesulfobacteriota bacterium]